MVRKAPQAELLSEHLPERRVAVGAALNGLLRCFLMFALPGRVSGPPDGCGSAESDDEPPMLAEGRQSERQRDRRFHVIHLTPWLTGIANQ